MLDAVISALERIDYHHEGNLGIAGREAFKYEGKTHLRKHHLYVCPRDSEELKRHIAFREYLRSHPEAVREYSRIKEEGAALYPFDIEKYIEYLTRWGPGLLRLGAIMSFGGYCVSRPGLLRLGAVVG